MCPAEWSSFKIISGLFRHFRWIYKANWQCKYISSEQHSLWLTIILKGKTFLFLFFNYRIIMLRISTLNTLNTIYMTLSHFSNGAKASKMPTCINKLNKGCCNGHLYKQSARRLLSRSVVYRNWVKTAITVTCINKVSTHCCHGHLYEQNEPRLLQRSLV